MTRMPTYFISHGGGPWPWIPSKRSELAPLEQSLSEIPSELPERPKLPPFLVHQSGLDSRFRQEKRVRIVGQTGRWVWHGSLL